MKWLRFTVGIGLLAAMISFFASGYTPPGVCGEVIRHNQQADIDASPFFYGVRKFSLYGNNQAEFLADPAECAPRPSA
jgi:hypothetical protein